MKSDQDQSGGPTLSHIGSEGQQPLSEPAAFLRAPLATALPGAEPLNIKTSNNCYKGQVLTGDEKVISVILKDLSSIELAKELIGLSLAKKLGLPVPDGFLTLVPNGVMEMSVGPLSAEGDRIAFASADVSIPSIQFVYLKNEDDGIGLVEKLADWPALGEVYGFDAWTANEDRNAGNMLIDSTGEVWLIDHGRIFTGPPWPGSPLEATSEYPQRLAEWLSPFLNDTQIEAAQKAASHLEIRLATFDIDDALALSGADSILASDEMEQVKSFLRDRSVLVSYYSNKALGRPTFV